jgi:hypothetical protein
VAFVPQDLTGRSSSAVSVGSRLVGHAHTRRDRLQSFLDRENWWLVCRILPTVAAGVSGISGESLGWPIRTSIYFSGGSDVVKNSSVLSASVSKEGGSRAR